MTAMNKTAVYMGEGFQSAIDQKSALSTYFPSTGYESAQVHGNLS